MKKDNKSSGSDLERYSRKRDDLPFEKIKISKGEDLEKLEQIKKEIKLELEKLISEKPQYETNFCPNCGLNLMQYKNLKDCPNCGYIIEDQTNFRQIIDLILNNMDKFQDFIIYFSELTLRNYKNLVNTKIFTFLLQLKESLDNFKYKKEADMIYKWIQIAREVKNIQIDDAIIFLDFITNKLKESKEILAIKSLIDVFFEEHKFLFKNFTYLHVWNEFSNFLNDIRHLIYELPIQTHKDAILDQIEHYTDFLAETYQKLIMYRMKKQDIDIILNFGPNSLFIVMERLIENISRANPVPISRCLTNLIDQWRLFPRLEKYINFGTSNYKYPYRIPSQIIIIKPIFWYIIIKIILDKIFMEHYRLLPKNETIYHENLLEMLGVYINYFYEHFNIPSVPLAYSQNRELFIKFLNQFNEKVHCSNEELKNLILNSKWKSDSELIFKRILEHKNYCIYCSFNMPPNANSCSNCGKPVKEVSFEKPTIDFEKMEDFFGKPSQE
ncbi:MAG: hypothetical protein ACFFCM_05680 [Promethearchaeota archaeon]